MTWLAEVTRGLQVTACLLVGAFPVRYIAAYPRTWYRSFEGRYLVLSKASFFLILSLAPLVLLFPNLAHWSGWPVVRALVYVVLVLVFLALNVMLTRAQRAAKIREAVREPLP